MGQCLYIFHKEMVESLRNQKTLAIGLLCVVVIPLSLFVHQATVVHRLDQQREAFEKHERALEEAATRYPELGGRIPADELEVQVIPPVPRLAALGVGLEDQIPDIVTFDIHGLSIESTLWAQRLVPDLLGRIDLLLLVKFVLSLAAVTLSFHLICGERETGTLKLLLVHGASRSKILLGKVVSALVLLAIPTGLGLAWGLGLLILTGSWDPAEGDAVRIGLLYGLSVLYLAFFVLAGAWVSALSRRCMSSLLAALLLWITVTVVLPETAGLVAEAIHPVESASQILQKRAELRTNLANQQREELRPLAAREDYEELRQEISTLYEERYRSSAAELDRRLETQLADQDRIASRLAAVSPAAALTFSWTALAGTGTEDVRHFYTELNAYQKTLRDTVFTGTYRDLFDHGLARGRIVLVDPGAVPRFQYRSLGLESQLRRVWPHATLLVLLDLIAWGGAWWAFRRYDVR